MKNFQGISSAISVYFCLHNFYLVSARGVVIFDVFAEEVVGGGGQARRGLQSRIPDAAAAAATAATITGRERLADDRFGELRALLRILWLANTNFSKLIINQTLLNHRSTARPLSRAAQPPSRRPRRPRPPRRGWRASTAPGGSLRRRRPQRRLLSRPANRRQLESRGKYLPQKGVLQLPGFRVI